jgi:zinc transport system substrate-binding protein
MQPSPLRRSWFALLVAAVALVAAACDFGSSQSPPAEGNAKATPNAASALKVFASHAALAYFTKRIGDESVTVWVPSDFDGDPAFWSPKAKDITLMQGSDLLVLNGATYEKWRSRVTLAERTVCETADAFKSEWIEVKEAVTHSHGTDGAHSHAGTAFTTWLDPMLAIEQARAIHARLAQLLPEQAKDLNDRFQGLERDLRALDGNIEVAVGNSNGLPIIFSHPVYEYFIRRYELNARTVHWEPEELPSADEFAAFSKLLEEHPAKWMVWEDEPGQAIRAKLRELGVECVVFAPAANMGDGWERWLDRQTENVAQFAKVFE